MPKLTQRTIEAIKVTDNEFIVWDEELPSYGVRVKPTGTKSFVIRYRNHARQQRFMTLGRVGIMKAERARKKAMSILADVSEGLDPAQQKKDVASTPTLAELRDRYFSDYAVPNKKPMSVETDKINFRLHIFPFIKSSKKVTDINRQDVEKMKAALKDKPASFNRARAVLSKAMELAEAWEIRPQNSNPCRHIPKYKLQGRERFLSSEEFARLGEALATAERNVTESEYAFAAIRLLIFLGARRGEILGLKWEDVDLEKQLIFLPDSKTGKKPIFINPPAAEVLASLKRVKGNPYVIVGRVEGQPLVDLKGPWNRIREAAGLSGVRIHDLRHSYASVGAIGGVPLHMLGKLLGHANVGTTERYAHLAADPLKAANDAIGNQIAAALNPIQGGAEVLNFGNDRA